MRRRARLQRLISILGPLVLVGSAAGPVVLSSAGPRAGALPCTGCSNQYGVAGSSPSSITTGPDGALWFTEWGKDKIGRITVAGKVTTWKLDTPEAGPTSIVAGPDGNLWFTETGVPRGPTIDQLGRISTGGSISGFPINGRPSAITAGPDGNLWFTAAGPTGPEIGKMSPSGVVGYIELKDQGLPITATVSGITTGSDGNLWFTTDAGLIGRITPSGTVTFFDIPGGGEAGGITAGPDGALWFTGYVTSVGDSIDRVLTNGIMTLYPIPAAEGSAPYSLGVADITAGADGNVWFTLYDTDQIGRISTHPGSVGQIAEYSVPVTGTSTPGPAGITTGPNGDLSFTDWTAVEIVEYPPSPVVSQTPVSGLSVNLVGVANGPNGDEWLTDDQHQVDHVCGTGTVQQLHTDHKRSALRHH